MEQSSLPSAKKPRAKAGKMGIWRLCGETAKGFHHRSARAPHLLRQDSAFGRLGR